MKAIRKKDKMEMRKDVQNFTLFGFWGYVTFCRFMSLLSSRKGMIIFQGIFNIPLSLPIYFGYCSTKFGYGSPLSILLWMIIYLMAQYTSWHIANYFFLKEKDWEELDEFKHHVFYIRYLYQLKKQGIKISVDMDDDFPETI
jgi:hypothetical protein